MKRTLLLTFNVPGSGKQNADKNWAGVEENLELTHSQGQEAAESQHEEKEGAKKGWMMREKILGYSGGWGKLL
ncbi:hypothetical protein A6R68_01448 [Neotoma lepida]|uniref:Uncharacterized protein n=1 Tax=Neotoma lepida TaxID=56216 RepID=A0A1A6GWL3_NEOLE|nr:hypothetical protein A6R68_01448 [Neotoma lepida]